MGRHTVLCRSIEDDECQHAESRRRGEGEGRGGEGRGGEGRGGEGRGGEGRGGEE